MNIQNRTKQYENTKSDGMIAGTLIVCGILLRLKLYMENRSLWLDEAWVANDIITRPFKHIFLANAQFSDLAILPMGFSFTEKLFIHFLGLQEYAIRAFPLFCGILSIILFYKLLKRISSSKTQLIALGLFVFSEPLIYYSAEAKQYSCDVMIALFIYLLMLHVKPSVLSMGRIRLLAAFGVVAITFSYPAVLVLIAVGAMFFFEIYTSKDSQKISGLIYIYFVWLLGLIFWYFVSYRFMTNNALLLSGAASHFVPRPIWSLEAMAWITKKIIEIFQYSQSQVWPIAAIALFMFGVKAVYNKDKQLCGALVVPVFLLFVMAALHKYPLLGRFFLFALPGIFILIAEGAEYIIRRFGRHKLLVHLLLICLLFAHPVSVAAFNMTHKIEKEENRPVMQFLKQNQKEGDRLCLNLSAQYAYLYYMGALNFQHNIQPIFVFSDKLNKDQNGEYVYGRSVFRDHAKRQQYAERNKKSPRLKIYKTHFEKFGRESRTWFLFSHSNQDLKEWMVSSLNRHGTMLKKFQRRGASVYLYDLSYN